MVNGTRSGLRNKDGESQSSRKKVDSREGISNASGRTATSSGSKQSAKGVLSGKTTSSPPSIRKSERLEKRTPTTTPVLRQSERLVNQGAPSPLRRSDRSKKNFSSSTSGSNQSSKNVSSVDTGKRKEKNEKSIKQLAVGSQRVIASEKYEQGSISPKRKRMDAHSYKSLFKSQKRRYLRSDSDGRLERHDRLSQSDGEESGGSDSKLVQDIEHENHQYDHALSPHVGFSLVKEHQGEPMRADSEAASLKPVPEFKDVEVNISENDVEAKISFSNCSNNVSEKTTNDLDRVDGNISVMGGTNKAPPYDSNRRLEHHSSAEISKIPELVAAINVQRSPDSDTCPETAAQSGKSKVQNYPRDIQCKVTEKEIGNDIHALVIESTGLTPSNLEKHEIIGSCVVCNKKRRLVYDSPEEELCSCSPVEKDTEAVYSSVLSLLGSSDFPEKASDLKSDTADNTAYSKFVEYLVPVEISNLQLEQYCGELLANAPALRSNCRTDHVGAFKEILMTLRKCCDHPYMVAPSLQSSMIKGLTQDQMLEIGIEASGKLQLLYEMLSKIRNLHLRALVLFQSISSSGEMAIGDILDDFMRGKFGSNSYERVDACLIPSKKQAALNRFSAVGSENFVFLLENRACQPSIKLSVDVVVIYDSDWNPANDLKALQRLSLHSKSGQVNVFRLYSSCTIEEKVLKQNMNIESSLQMIKFSSNLLMWGASHLFSRLEEYHAGNGTDNVADISHGQKLMCDVLSELSAILSCSRKEDESETVISKVLRNAGTYTTNFPLLGEKKVQLTDMEVPHIFWKKLLEGKEPKWKFSLGQMPRSRKRVQYAQETSKISDHENDNTARKRKKLLSTNLSVAPLQLEPGEEQVEKSNKGPVAITSNMLDSKNTSSYPSHQGSSANLNCKAHLQEKSPSDEQKNLHSSVKEEMLKLSVVLKLTKEVQQMIDRFLEYIMENHHVNKEPASILQAFQMSLCWAAASILKQKIDKKESLELAKEILDFKCTEEEAISVYLKLRLLKKTFLQLPGVNSGSLSENIKSVSRNIRPPSSGDAGESLSGSFNLQNVKASQELTQVQKSNNMLTGNDLKRRIKKIEKKCEKCISKLRLKHAMETQAFNKTWAETKETLVAGHRKEVIFIRAIHGTGPMGTSKLEIAETKFAKKMADHEHLKEVELKKLQEKHSAAIEEKKKIFDNWLTEAISCNNPCKTVTEVHTCGSESEGEIVPDAHSINIIPNLPVHSAIETFGRENPTRTGPILLNLNSEKELESAIVEMSSIPGVNGKENCPSSQALEDIPLLDISSENHVIYELPSTSQNNNMPSGGPCNTGSETGHDHAIGIGTLDVDQYADETPLTNQDHEMATGVSGNDGLEMRPDHAIDVPVELSLGNDKGEDTSQDVEDIPSVDISSENHVTDELPSTSQNNSMPSGATCNTGCETGHVHSVGIGTLDEDQYADETPLTNQCREMATGVSGNDGREMGPNHNAKALVGLSLGNDKGDGTSDVTRNPKGQHDVHITDSLPSDGVPFQNRESMDMQHEDIPVPGNQTTTIGTVPFTPSGGRTNSVSNLEEFENNEQLEQASIDKDPSSCPGPAAAEDVCQGHCKESNSLQDAVGSPQLPESTEVPCQTISQNVENTVPQPPMEFLDSAQGRPDLLAANRGDHAPNSELPTHSQIGEAQVSQDVTEPRNQAVSQPGPNSALVEASHIQLYGAHRVAYSNASLPLHADPLQNELEKIHKEIEQVIKLHDNTKLQLKSDCEKEIEEMAAQIRKKYEAKMKGAEAVFVLKKSELESNQNKVLMNKILAEAFKSKCMDLRHTGISGVPKVVPSFTQHLHQLSLRQSRLSPAISQHTANLPIQSTHHSPGNFSAVPTRPPLINAITPTIVNSRVGGEVRAPAPHLQPFRPPVCTSSANMPSRPYNPNQQVPANVPVTSSSLSVHQPQKTLLMTSQFSQPNLPPLGVLPPVNIVQSGPSNQLSETEGGAQPRSYSSTPISALELLRDVHNQPSGNAPNILPCSGSYGGGVDVASGVVCVSDDDD